MITITTTESTIAGEPSYLPPEFINAIILLISIAIVGCILIILNIYFRKKDEKRLERTTKIIATLSIIVPVFIFLTAINELSRVSVGGIIGNGYLDIGVPGESLIHSVLCNWGFGIGFYIYIISIIIFFMIITLNYLKKI
jgi:hypothetical protein